MEAMSAFLSKSAQELKKLIYQNTKLLFNFSG